MSAIKPVLFVLTSHKDLGKGHDDSGFYLPELTHPLHVLDEAGIATEFASILGGEPPVYGIDLEDKINKHYWENPAFRENIRNTLALDKADSSKYSAIMYVGGHGVMWDFPDSNAVKHITKEMYENGQIVAAVCHGPAALVNVKLSDGSYLVAGKNVAAFTDTEEQEVGMADTVPFLLESALKQRGAHHHGVPNWHEKVVVDGNLITGQNPQSATGVGKAILNALKGN
ncbi:ThiJ/PfpI family protein [Pantoea sp. AS-PWVM4]|uniref:type 1 glutamine amidotransferase domain-containing protein n=1 Tax=Pantoea sp. AS-PWVM4 TaxID=1332069 RepID=UPI0003AC7FE1|nr:type 1 glutamine amidotransferase domain-containing protein [Pantoea sp. AS-PWVM4]ERK16266.1 ThiJ/PfpI family protein [Pantoea sp. AS-PWVM4]